MPRPALVFSLLGLLPFFAGVAGAWLFPGRNFVLAINLQMAYGAIVLSFLGAVHWGLAMAQGEAGSWRRLGLSVVPAVTGWVALMIVVPLGLLLLAIGFAGMFFADHRAVTAGRAPAWYKSLRKLLTVLVLASLILSYWALAAKL